MNTCGFTLAEDLEHLRMEQSKLLKYLRRKSGLSQVQLSKKSGLSLSTICKAEQGDRLARWFILADIVENGLDMNAEIFLSALTSYHCKRHKSAIEAYNEFIRNKR